MVKTSINDITYKLLENSLQFEAEIVKVNPKQPQINTGIFECKSCCRIYEVEQKNLEVHEPTMCSECGGRKFKILKEQSKYDDIQKIKVKDTKKFVDKYNRERDPLTIDCILYNRNVNHYIKEDKVKITGTLKLDKKNKEYIEVSNIKLLNENT